MSINKTAICLYGKYSPWYKKNNFNLLGDVIAFPFTQQDASVCQSDTNISRTFCISDIEISECKQINYPAMLDYTINHRILKTISSQYSNFIIFPFNAVIISNFKTTSNITTYGDILDHCIEIISDLWVRNVNTPKSVPLCIYDITEPKLQYVLDRLFSGKVLLPSNIHKIPKSSVLYGIQSVIKTSTVPLKIVQARSVYTHEERFNQTLEQVSSLHAYLETQPVQSTIVLAEGSLLNLSQLESLSKYCYVVLYGYDKTIHDYANSYPNKSIYEMVVFKDMINKLEFDWFIKFGGRYRILSGVYNQNLLLRDKPVFNELKPEFTFTGESSLEIIMYSFPKNYKQEMTEIYDKSIKTIQDEVENDKQNVSAEFCMNAYIKEKNIEYIHIPRFYITGNDALFGFPKIL